MNEQATESLRALIASGAMTVDHLFAEAERADPILAAKARQQVASGDVLVLSVLFRNPVRLELAVRDQHGDPRVIGHIDVQQRRPQ